MAKVSTDLAAMQFRWVTPEGVGWTIRSDRAILRHDGTHWRRAGSVPQEYTIAEYAAQQMKGIPEVLHGRNPPMPGTVTRWLVKGRAKALDGCETSFDGFCRHGFPSWPRAQGHPATLKSKKKPPANPDKPLARVESISRRRPVPSNIITQHKLTPAKVWERSPSDEKRMRSPRTKHGLVNLVNESPERVFITLDDGSDSFTLDRAPSGRYLVTNRAESFAAIITVRTIRTVDDVPIE